MKHILIIMIAVGLVFSALAKPLPEKKVPIPVKLAFYQENPDALNVKWGVIDDSSYVVDFMIGKKHGTAYYTGNGALIESDIAINWKDVPLAGRMEIYHLHNQGQVHNVLKVKNQKKENYYMVFVRNKLNHYAVLLDSDGNIVRVTKAR